MIADGDDHNDKYTNKNDEENASEALLDKEEHKKMQTQQSRSDAYFILDGKNLEQQQGQVSGIEKLKDDTEKVSPSSSPQSFELEKIKKTQSRTPWLKIATLFLAWLGIVALSILKGGGNGNFT